MAEEETAEEQTYEERWGFPPDFEPTISKVRRGALPEDDPLMRLQRRIEELRAFAARL
jgi:hypothetical protein